MIWVLYPFVRSVHSVAHKDTSFFTFTFALGTFGAGGRRVLSIHAHAPLRSIHMRTSLVVHSRAPFCSFRVRSVNSPSPSESSAGGHSNSQFAPISVCSGGEFCSRAPWVLLGFVRYVYRGAFGAHPINPVHTGVSRGFLPVPFAYALGVVGFVCAGSSGCGCVGFVPVRSVHSRAPWGSIPVRPVVRSGSVQCIPVRPGGRRVRWSLGFVGVR